MSKVLVSESSLTSTASAIRATLNSNDTMLPSQFFDNIEEMVREDLDPNVTPVFKIPKGNVNFYDYDGELLYSYSSKEFIKKGILPDNPHHEDLIAQGWNWEYEEILKQAIQVGGDINVGQMYITQSGATQIDIELDQNSLEPYLAFPFSTNTEFTIDWGDNSEIIQREGYSNITFNQKHIYEQPGSYTIKINVIQGQIDLSYIKDYSILLWCGNNNITNDIYRNKIVNIRFGNNIQIGTKSFMGCSSLKSITISNSITSIGSYAFSQCYSLKSIIIPNSITTMGGDFRNCYSLKLLIIPNKTFSFNRIAHNCYSLKSITIPNSITSIETYAVSNCYSLTSITIPNSITTIGSYAFRNCYNILEYHFKLTTPPTLNANVFTGINQNCKIYVPYSSDHSILNAYKTATNWSTWADYIIEEKDELNDTAAYAVFDSQDGSLTFFRGEPNSFTNGQVIGTKTYYIGIESTGVSSTPPWYGKRNNIQKVIFKNQVYPIYCYRWFWDCTNLTQFINLDKLNTLQVVNMNSMFKGCSSLRQLDLSNFNTLKNLTMQQMFSGCSFLEKLNLTSFNTANVQDMSYMFNGCSSLTQLDLTSFNTKRVYNISYMFYDCSSLTQLDLSNFDITYVSSIQSMFEGCSSLKQLNLSNFQFNHFSNDLSFSLEYMFRNCSALQSLDLSNFRITKNCTSMYGMFEDCSSLKHLDLSSFIFSEDTETTSMFSGCSKLSTSLTFSEMPTIYSNMFLDAATQSGAAITLKYVSPVTSNNIDTLVATGSNNSNIINGGEGISINPEKIVGIIPNTNTIIQVPSEVLNFTTTPEYHQYQSSTPITYEYDGQEYSYPILVKSYCSFNLEDLNIKPIFSIQNESNNLYSMHLQYKGNLSLNILDQSDNIIWTGNSDIVKNSFNDINLFVPYQQLMNSSLSEQLVDFNIIINKINNQTKIFSLSEGNNIYFYDNNNNNNKIQVTLGQLFILNQNYINCNLVCDGVYDSDNILNGAISYDQETNIPLFKLQFTFNDFEAKIIYEDRRKISCPMKLVDSNSTIQAVLPTDATGTVKFTAGEEESISEVINGVATLNPSDFTLGKANVKTLYSGDEKYSYTYDNIFTTITMPYPLADRPLLYVDTEEAENGDEVNYSIVVNIIDQEEE